MPEKILTPTEAAEHRRLYLEWERAVAHAGQILSTHGMESREFLEADSAAGDVYRAIRKLLGKEEQHWMS